MDGHLPRRPRTRGNEHAVHKLCYSAGVLVLSKKHPRVILYRSPEPVLTPDLPQERIGTVANVVFPTAIDRRDDLGMPDRFDIYYGMADNRIGVAQGLERAGISAGGGTSRPDPSRRVRIRATVNLKQVHRQVPITIRSGSSAI